MLSEILDLFENHGLQCKALRLARNRLDDSGVIRLTEMLLRQREAIEELHLCSNYITARGFMILLTAVARHPLSAYPWQTKTGTYQPTWLRMENNRLNTDLDEPGLLLECLSTSAGVLVCVPTDLGLCGPTRCHMASRIGKDSPVAHLSNLYEHDVERCAREPGSGGAAVACVSESDLLEISENLLNGGMDDFSFRDRDQPASVRSTISCSLKKW